MGTLTVPMHKDFMNKPIDEYKAMINTINIDHQHSNYNSAGNIGSKLQNANNVQSNDMQNELQIFLNELKHSNK